MKSPKCLHLSFEIEKKTHAISTFSILKRNIPNQNLMKCIEFFPWLSKTTLACPADSDKHLCASINSFNSGLLICKNALCCVFNCYSRPGVNFTKVLHTAFTPVDPKSRKNTVKASVSFYAFGIYKCKSCT